MNKLYFNCNYGILPKNVMKDRNLSIGAKGVFAYLCAYAGSEDHSFPSRDLITHELGINKDTLTKYMKELKESRYIQVKQNKTNNRFANNIYYITPDKQPIIQEEYSTCPKISDTKPSDTKPSDTKEYTYTNNSITNNNIINNNNTNKKEKRNTEIDDLIESYTDNKELIDTLYEFIKFRKGIKKAMTTQAVKLMLNKLNKLSNNDSIKIEILNQSILNGWTGIFELKNGYNRNITNNNNCNSTETKGEIKFGVKSDYIVY